LAQASEPSVNLQQRKPEPTVLLNPPATLLGVKNAILLGKGRRHHIANFPGPLSIKSVVRGSVAWETDKAELLVDTSNYLVLNAGRRYSLTIDSREATETFCLFFRHGIVEDVFRVDSTDRARLLDDPVFEGDGTKTKTSTEFIETLHAHDSVVSPILQKMYARVINGSATQAWLEDQFFETATALFRIHKEASKRAAKIPAKKSSTQIELYRRLLRGRDYLDSFFGAPVHLVDVAREACLSPYHFHRLFREVFRETPNQYLQRKRLANAQRLLERGEQSVTDICLEVGFESIGSFSGLFRRSFGCSPRAYRSRKNKTR
jgi:AraC family transcriptional regulator